MHTRHYKAHRMFRTSPRLIYRINPSVRTPAPRPCPSPSIKATELHRQTTWTPHNPHSPPRPRAAESPDSSPLRDQQAGVGSASFPSPIPTPTPTPTPIRFRARATLVLVRVRNGCFVLTVCTSSSFTPLSALVGTVVPLVPDGPAPPAPAEVGAAPLPLGPAPSDCPSPGKLFFP
jgi:hypothetical protein